VGAGKTNKGIYVSRSVREFRGIQTPNPSLKRGHRKEYYIRETEIERN